MVLFLGFTILFHTHVDTFHCQTRSITWTSHLEDETLPFFRLVHTFLCLHPLNTFIYAITCIVFK